MDSNNDSETDDIMNCESEALNQGDGHYHSTQAILPNYKSLVAKLRALEDCGIESSSIALPKMIVVGDQNAGKSSLIERISDITVPRASGTCTRCPIRITLQEHDGPWSCSVTLEKKYFYAEPNKWVLLKPDERNDFARLTTPEHLEEIINRAQLALINPGRAWHEFRQSIDNTKEVDFSPNIVCVNIQSRTSPNLSIIDLPGVISQHEHGKVYVSMIDKLVEQYVEDPNSIILQVSSVSEDMATSKAGGIIRSFPATDRCMGILTKADLFEDTKANRLRLREILAGREDRDFPLGHGYYVAKQPSESQLEAKISRADATLSESLFFQNPTWTELRDSYPDRFGIDNIVQSIEQILGDAVKERIPQITYDLQVKINDIDRKLELYPKPKNALATVHSVLATFENAVLNVMVGERPYRDLKQKLHEATTEFQSILLTRMRPRMDPISRGDPRSTDPEVIPIEDDEVVVTPTKKRKRANAMEVTPRPKPENSKQTQPLEQQTFSLDDIRERINLVSRLDMPNSQESEAIMYTIDMLIGDWDYVISTYTFNIAQVLHEQLGDMLQYHLRAWSDTLLAKQMTDWVNQYSLEVSSAVKAQALHRLKLEKFTFMTLDTEHFSELALKAYSTIKEVRDRNRLSWAQNNVKKTLTVDSLGPDPFEPELRVMARVLAGYDLAAHRLVDGLYQLVRVEIMGRCREEFSDRLRAAVLGADEDATPVHYELLISHSTDRERERYSLLEEKERLVKAYEAIQSS